jgi:hypothetical protein
MYDDGDMPFASLTIVKKIGFMDNNNYFLGKP